MHYVYTSLIVVLSGGSTFTATWSIMKRKKLAIMRGLSVTEHASTKMYYRLILKTVTSLEIGL